MYNHSILFLNMEIRTSVFHLISLVCYVGRAENWRRKIQKSNCSFDVLLFLIFLYEKRESSSEMSVLESIS